MSFIRTYGGNTDTMAHSGMKGVQAAIDAGMTIHQIEAQAAREGISFGHKARDYIDARKGTFIGKYGGNEGTMANAGLQAVNAASAAGLSYDEMRRQAAAEGVQFMSGAQNLFKQYDQQQAMQKHFDSQLAQLQQRMIGQQASYDKSLQSMQNTLMATMQPNNRESVLGIKGATVGTGSEGQQMARQGVKGNFARSGMRIQKIIDKALNVT